MITVEHMVDIKGELIYDLWITYGDYSISLSIPGELSDSYEDIEIFDGDGENITEDLLLFAGDSSGYIKTTGKNLKRVFEIIDKREKSCDY